MDSSLFPIFKFKVVREERGLFLRQREPADPFEFAEKGIAFERSRRDWLFAFGRDFDRPRAGLGIGAGQVEFYRNLRPLSRLNVADLLSVRSDRVSLVLEERSDDEFFFRSARIVSVFEAHKRFLVALDGFGHRYRSFVRAEKRVHVRLVGRLEVWGIEKFDRIVSRRGFCFDTPYVRAFFRFARSGEDVRKPPVGRRDFERGRISLVRELFGHGGELDILHGARRFFLP